MQAWVFISENSRYRTSADTAKIDGIKQRVMSANKSAYFGPFDTSADKSRRIPCGRANKFTPGPAKRYLTCPPVNDRYGIRRLIRVLAPSMPDGAYFGAAMHSCSSRFLQCTAELAEVRADALRLTSFGNASVAKCRPSEFICTKSRKQAGSEIPGRRSSRISVASGTIAMAWLVASSKAASVASSMNSCLYGLLTGKTTKITPPVARLIQHPV